MQPSEWRVSTGTRLVFSVPLFLVPESIITQQASGQNFSNNVDKMRWRLCLNSICFYLLFHLVSNFFFKLFKVYVKLL